MDASKRPSAGGVAMRRRQRRLRSWWRHEQRSIAAALAATHHSAPRSGWPEQHKAPRGPMTASATEEEVREVNDALLGQKREVAGPQAAVIRSSWLWWRSTTGSTTPPSSTSSNSLSWPARRRKWWRRSRRSLNSWWATWRSRRARQSTEPPAEQCALVFLVFIRRALVPGSYLFGAGLPEEYIYAVFLGEYFRICRIQRFLVQQWIHVTASQRRRGYCFRIQRNACCSVVHAVRQSRSFLLVAMHLGLCSSVVFRP